MLNVRNEARKMLKKSSPVYGITLLSNIILALCSISRAEISWSGDIDPADPTTWRFSYGTGQYIGKTGSGILNITNGSNVAGSRGITGYESAAQGEVNITGNGSFWNCSEDNIIGWYGNGAVNINNGGKLANEISRIAYQTGSTGTVTVSGIGSTWTCTGKIFEHWNLVVGENGDGTLNITNGGEVICNSQGGGISHHTHVAAGSNAKGLINIDGAGSRLTASEDLHIASGGNGELNIKNGGMASSAANCWIGTHAGSNGKTTVQGTGSVLQTNECFAVGWYGTGTLEITDGGLVTAPYNYIGNWNGLKSQVVVDGEGSTWNCSDLSVGFSGQGTLEITNRGLVIANILKIDKNFEGGNDSVNISSSGMLALKGNTADSITNFLSQIQGTDAINFWDNSLGDWSHISNATYNDNYTLQYLAKGDLAGYTVLAVVPEPVSALLLLFGSLTAVRRHIKYADRLD